MNPYDKPVYYVTWKEGEPSVEKTTWSHARMSSYEAYSSPDEAIARCLDDQRANKKSDLRMLNAYMEQVQGRIKTISKLERLQHETRKS